MRRVSIDIPEEMYQELQAKVPWGQRSQVLRSLLRMTLWTVDEVGLQGLALILEKKYFPPIGRLE